METVLGWSIEADKLANRLTAFAVILGFVYFFPWVTAVILSSVVVGLGGMFFLAAVWLAMTKF